MATAIIGKLDPFREGEEKITEYLERVELYLVANDVPAEKKVPVLLSAIGAKTYALLRSLVTPTAPKDKSFEEIADVLKAHFEPKPIRAAERYYFRRRLQAPGESIAEYVAELRRLSTHCRFDGYLEDELCDQLVCGLRNENIRTKLLTIEDLTFKKAFELSQSYESAKRNAQQLKEASGAVHKVTPQKPSTARRDSQVCYRCGLTNHRADKCRFKEAICYSCGKKGHLKRACRSRKKNMKSSKQTNVIDTDQQQQESDDGDSFTVCYMDQTSNRPIHVELLLDGKPCDLEVDTGAAVSIMSEKRVKKVLPGAQLRKTNVSLRTYTAQKIPVKGKLQVMVQYGQQQKSLTCYVVEGDGPCLMGRDWLKHIRLNWREISTTILDTTQSRLKSMLEEHKEVFKDELGTMNSIRAKLQVKENATPRFHRPRPVPFALKEAIEREIHRLEEAGILKKINHCEWAAPIVPVPKKDGSVRVCGDYKVTINEALDVDQYPLPRPEDLFATLANGKTFSKLDLAQAYQQMLLDSESEKYLTINTHLGLYQYVRLPFGVASAPAMFQRAMDIILQGIPGVICYIDDILVTGETDEQHLDRLELVLKRLKEYGLRVKQKKCEFLKESVEYLGHKVDAQGLHTLPSKLTAIVEAPEPRNVHELRSFLGLLNYYSKFIPNLASLVHPLNHLLRHDVKWNWSAECATAFREAKKSLVSSQVLAHYNPVLPIKMAADASAYGVGAVISHVYPDGSEKPIAFASRTLSKSQKNYAQLEKEALALVFGVRRFHQYLYGRNFTLVTDHKPLTTILGPKKGIPPLAAARLQRWALLLSAYRYDIEFKPTGKHGNADGLSRLPVEIPSENEERTDVEVFNVAQIDALPVTAQQLGKATRSDPILSKVWRYTRTKWPDKMKECLKPYWNRRNELTIEGSCVMWGIRVVIPRKLQSQVLEELHRDHPGIVRMKSIARSHMWWPGIDKQLEEASKSCVRCQAIKSKPAVAPLHPWLWPSRPWQRIHVDFAGPFKGKMFFIVVDGHSKWPEVIEMKSTTSEKTIEILRQLFACYGLPEQLVSDNGTQFTSDEFARFTKANGIKHIRTTPYHPSSNGLAERFVQTFKRAMTAGQHDGKTFQHRLSNFLLTYRSAPHATTNQSPCSLFLKREVRTRFDLMKPDHERQVTAQQALQKMAHDSRAKVREFVVGQDVMARNYRDGDKWTPGVIVERKGPLSYVVQVNSGLLWRRHVDQIRERIGAVTTPAKLTTPVSAQAVLSPFDIGGSDPEHVPDSPITNERNSDAAPPEEPSDSETVTETDTVPETETEPVRRYPQRVRHAPQMYGH